MSDHEIQVSKEEVMSILNFKCSVAVFVELAMIFHLSTL